MIAFFTMLLPMIVSLMGCSDAGAKCIIIPKIPHHAINQVESQLHLRVESRGHVTQEGLKIPLIGFDTTQTIHDNTEVLRLYKKAYEVLATSMALDEEANSWENRLFKSEQPRVWLSLANVGEKTSFSSRPYIAFIAMGPKGTIGLSYWNTESERLVEEDETSLRELFVEELASGKEE